MKKFLLLFLCCPTFAFHAMAGFGISSSAVYLTLNGSLGYYNTKNASGSTPLGTISFAGNLGAFSNNSGNLKIMGAAINTFTNSGSNICGGTLYYTVYVKGNRPATPVFSSIALGLYSTNSSSQQWLNINNEIDLTAFPVGDYMLEVYYVASGNDASGNCSQTKLDNAAGADYTASFSIADPLALSFSSLYGIVDDASIGIKWTTQSDQDILEYEVQKSDNGLDFTTIGTVGSKQSNTVSNYYYADLSPLVGANYYRIKADNNNSTVSLTNIIRLYFITVENSVLIYPNPTGNILTVRLAGITKDNYQLSILSSSGQTVLSMPENYDGNAKSISINLPTTLPQGIYWLFLIDKEQFYKQQFIVK